jgi:hypothetical protein
MRMVISALSFVVSGLVTLTGRAAPTTEPPSEHREPLEESHATAAPSLQLPPAAPDRGPKLVLADVLLVSSNRGIRGWIDYQTSSSPSATISVFRLAPTADYVLDSGLTIGAGLEFSRRAITPTNPGLGGFAGTNENGVIVNLGPAPTYRFGIAPRIGYYGRIGNQVGLWARGSVGVAVDHTGATSGGLILPDVNLYEVSARVDPVVAWMPAPHLLLTAGPDVRATYQTGNRTEYKALTIGLAAAVNLSW